MCALCTEGQDGYYHNFIGNIEFHMDEPWYNVRDFLRVLRRIKKLDFSVPEERYKALCWLNGMCCTVPYGPTTRFPYNEFYITEARGSWGELLNRLKRNLADNCMIKFEVEKAALPRFGIKFEKSRTKKRSDSADNTKCCSKIVDFVTPKGDDYCDHDVPNCCAPESQFQDNYCPITSDNCDSCLGPEPPSCCPDWCGNCEVKKIPAASFKCYMKGFMDDIEKMMKGIERREFVFSRKTFENHYKVVWTKYKRTCDILQESDSDEDYICDDCCLKDQAQVRYSN